MSIELRCIYASLPKSVRGEPLVVNGDPKNENMLYCNGNTVIIRNIENSSIADLYTQHATQTTCAKYSPSGFYIASADQSGKVRIWDTVNKEHILKNEFQPLSGAIKDLAWSSDNQRIVAVGSGREKFGHVFNAETGTSTGEIMGQAKTINACDFKSSRPFRIATASEDFSVAFFHGPPFKFNLSINDHTRFVNALKYSPDGEVFISAGADGKAYVYDGKTAEKLRELGDPAHGGGIYALSFNGDSTRVVTVSGDKSAKVWDVATGELVQQFVLGTKVEDMQVGCVWQKGPKDQKDQIVTVSVSGYLNYLDFANPSKPKKIIKGHNKPITALTISEDRSTIYTAASDGNICHWDASSGENDIFSGKSHSNQVQCMKCVDGQLISCGMDDAVMFTDISSASFGNLIKLPSQPRYLDAVSGGLVVVACINHVVVLRNGNIVFTQQVIFEPTSVSIHPGKEEVAIGGASDQKVHIFSLSGDTLTDTAQHAMDSRVTAVSYSHNGSMLAAADSNRKIMLFQLPGYEKLISSDWSFHTAKVNSLDWSPNDEHLASGGLDCSIFLFTPADKRKIISCKNAHPMANITNVRWIDDNTLVSVAQDSNMKVWNVKF